MRKKMLHLYFSKFIFKVRTTMKGLVKNIVGDNTRITGADPENVKPGGANSINYQTERGAWIYFLVLHIRANRGACAGCAPL